MVIIAVHREAVGVIVPRSARNIQPTRGKVIFFALLIVTLLMDIFNEWAQLHAPQFLGHLTCLILPISNLAGFFVSHELLGFISGQCGDVVIQEPAISVIFFMFKVILAIFASIVFVVMECISPMAFTIVQQRNSNAFENNMLKSIGKFLVVLFLFLAVGMIGFMDTSLLHDPQQFSIKPISKWLEDCLMLLVFCIFVSCSLYVASLVFFLCRDKKGK